MWLSQSNQPNGLGRARLGHARDTDLTPWEEQQARNIAPEFAAEWESQSQTAVSRSPSSYSEMEPPTPFLATSEFLPRVRRATSLRESKRHSSNQQKEQETKVATQRYFKPQICGMQLCRKD